MATISLRRLSDKTIAKYEQLEKDGKLSKRQRQMWDSHKAMIDFDGRGNSFMDLWVKSRRADTE